MEHLELFSFVWPHCCELQFCIRQRALWKSWGTRWINLRSHANTEEWERCWFCLQPVNASCNIEFGHYHKIWIPSLTEEPKSQSLQECSVLGYCKCLHYLSNSNLCLFKHFMFEGFMEFDKRLINGTLQLVSQAFSFQLSRYHTSAKSQWFKKKTFFGLITFLHYWAKKTKTTIHPFSNTVPPFLIGVRGGLKCIRMNGVDRHDFRSIFWMYHNHLCVLFSS